MKLIAKLHTKAAPRGRVRVVIDSLSDEGKQLSGTVRKTFHFEDATVEEVVTIFLGSMREASEPTGD